MDYGIELMLEIADMDMYYGLGNNLNRIIRIEDMVNTRFDNDYFDLLSAMLIYHQIVEELMKSLIAIGNFNTRLNLFPQKMPIKIKFDREFYKLVKELEEGSRQSSTRCVYASSTPWTRSVMPRGAT